MTIKRRILLLIEMMISDYKKREGIRLLSLHLYLMMFSSLPAFSKASSAS